MKPGIRLVALTVLCLAILGAPAIGADLGDVSDAVAGSLRDAGEAAVAVASDDRPAANVLLASALGSASDALDDIDDSAVQSALGRKAASAAKRLEKYVSKL